MITWVYQKMKKIDLIRKLEKYPVFGLKIVKGIISKENEYTKLVVHRLKKEGVIYEIEKNKYTLNKNPIVIASNIIWPSYISFWSALRYYNLTEQLPNAVFMITTRSRKKRELNFNDTKIIFVKIKPKYFFGYRKEKYDNFDIFIADKEKALLDSILFKKISALEIGSILKENIKDINMNLLFDYIIKTKNKTLAKRIGYLADKCGVDLYERLKKLIDYKYVVLDYSFRKKGKKNKKWRIIENVKL